MSRIDGVPLKSSMWTPMPCIPDLVGEREGHCSAVATLAVAPHPDGDNVAEVHFAVVIGGFVDGGFSPTAIAARLPPPSSCETSALCWCPCGTMASVCEVDGMSMVADVAAQSFWLFGGMDGETYTVRNTLYKVRWELMAAADDDASTSLDGGATPRRLALNFGEGDGSSSSSVPSAIRTMGSAPSPRYRHSASYAESAHKLFVFGGVTADEHQTNDLYVLDTNSLVWSQVLLGEGDVPSPRFLASVLYVSRSQENAVASASGCCEGLQRLYALVLYGGAYFDHTGSQKSLSDVWLIDVRSVVADQDGIPSSAECLPRWQPCSTSAHPLDIILPRVNGHCGLVVRTEASSADRCSIELLYFGGKDFERASNHLFLLTVECAQEPSSCAVSCSDIATPSWCVAHTAAVRALIVPGRTDDDIAQGGGDDAFLSDGTAPHWRYTATIAALTDRCTGETLFAASLVLLIAGQCRHNDPTAVYHLNLSEVMRGA